MQTNLSLHAIQTRLTLNLTQVAELFGVTRKVVYDWFENKPPNHSQQDQIDTVLLFLDSLPPVDSKLKHRWRIELEGESFLSVLQNENISVLDRAEALKSIYVYLCTTDTKELSSSSYHGYLGEAHMSEFDRRSN